MAVTKGKHNKRQMATSRIIFLHFVQFKLVWVRRGLAAYHKQRVTKSIQNTLRMLPVAPCRAVFQDTATTEESFNFGRLEWFNGKWNINPQRTAK